MSDDDGIPELDLPPPPPPRPPAPAPVRSAARANPVAEAKKKLTKDDLREGAADLVLNAVSMLGEVLEDFRSSDRYFKYKALVLSAWLVMTVTSVSVACPGGGDSNSIGARLVMAGDATAPIYMVKNDSDHEWRDVEVVVNNSWRTTAAQIRTNGDITLSPRLLIDAAGQPAPNTLRITEIFVQTNDGDATLLRGGKPR